eukprot:TRINITY_DN27405_c0_g1_i1.p1 TRINITY_DN27405_c0_g1~~TRINITY_DN27405_c0_g1_i1.p1  ORF type:complete len:741 (+),score=144.00 TRINITY_DN27405_c0_g1_i1:89-2311(+)
MLVAALRKVAVALLFVLARGGDSPTAAHLPWSPDPVRYKVPVQSRHTRETLSLYPPDGVVGVEAGDTLTEKLKEPSSGGSRWTVVEIYDYTCPHCWYAVPIYTQVARAYQGTTSLQFTSLNCHLHYNMETCFLLEKVGGVQDFPSFLLCPPLSQVADSDGEVAALPEEGLALLRRLPPGSPSHKTILELARCRRKFVEARVRGGAEDPFLSAQEIAGWITKETGLQASRPEELLRGADFRDPQPVSAIAPPGPPGWVRDDKVGEPGVSRFVPGERWYDALVGFVVLVYKGYSPEKYEATLHCTRYLSSAFPVKGQQLSQLATRLEHVDPNAMPSDVRGIVKAWSIEVGLGNPEDDTGDEKKASWHGLVARKSRGGETPRLHSLTCPSASTCNMWILLHVTLTAVAARGFSGRSLVGDGSVLSSGDGSVLALQSVETGIQEAQGFVRAFVDSFLNCHECRRRFLWDYDNCAYGRCEFKDWKALPLWLWRVHNAVNLHVARIRRAPVDRRWPSYEDCPACWNSDLVMRGSVRALQGSVGDGSLSESSWSKDELDAPFHTKVVFWHLVRTFVGVRRIVFALDDFKGEEREEVNRVLYKEGLAMPEEELPSRRSHSAERDEVVVDRSSGLGLPGSDTSGVVAGLHPLEKRHSSSQIFLGLLALAALVASIICYFGQETEEGGLGFTADDIDMEMVDREFMGETRAPIFKNPAAVTAREEEDDDAELVQDTPPAVSTEQIAEAAE